MAIIIGVAVVLIIAVLVSAWIIMAQNPMSGMPAVAKGDDDKAVKALQEIADKDSGSRKAEIAMMRLAAIFEKRQDVIKARDSYQKMMDVYPGSKDIALAESKRSEMNIKIMMSPLLSDDSAVYVVQRGDTLSKIARKFGTTISLIMIANNLTDTDIMVGQRLKVQRTKFSIVVDRSQNTLMLKSGNSIVKTYRVSTGANGSTPSGTFTITNKIINPVWYKTGAAVPPGSPNNILGTRWMGISRPSYGIHGTTDAKSIGRSVSSGCVRMTNQEVEELYTIVPEGTEVVILD